MANSVTAQSPAVQHQHLQLALITSLKLPPEVDTPALAELMAS
jgi:hypothetical protein